MRRRELIRLGALLGTTLISRAGSARVLAGRAAINWSSLGRKLTGRFAAVRSPLKACADAGGTGADALFAKIANPYFLGDEPGLTQTLGWTGAWTSQPSDYVAAIESAADAGAAIDFARREGVPLVVKGGGHSYYGNSNRARSLLIWTKRLQDIVLHDDFVGVGCPPNAVAVPAVSIGAGALWGRVYEEVSVKHGRYVQGGGCLTVGVAGFVQGGGFGSLSKQYGTGAANLLEAEIVTADGVARIANAVREPELFFALKGGGGGTFGVVTRVTLRTHDLPATIGAMLFELQAKSDAAWRALVTRLIAFYAEALFNPQWGEQLRFAPRRRLSVSMVFHGLDQATARAVWQPFLAWIAERPGDYVMANAPMCLAVAAQRFWDPAFLKSLPGIVLQDSRPGASPSNIFWASNLSEAGQVLHAYQSAWMPAALLAADRQKALVDAIVDGSAIWSMTLHTNKGMAGGAADAVERTRVTATNPAVLDAFALLICAADAPPAWPGIPGHEPDLALGQAEAAKVTAAMAPIRRLVPDAGAYVSEADYFDADWQRRYWGTHYPRLARIKQRYDPGGLFGGRHTVGSA